MSLSNVRRLTPVQVLMLTFPHLTEAGAQEMIRDDRMTNAYLSSLTKTMGCELIRDESLRDGVPPRDASTTEVPCEGEEDSAERDERMRLSELLNGRKAPESLYPDIE